MREINYHLGNILNADLGTEEAVQVTLEDGQIVTATLRNGEEGVTVAITGSVNLPDVCARCGKDIVVPVVLPGEPVEVDPNESVINLCDSSNEEIELQRPDLVYCAECQEKSNAS